MPLEIPARQPARPQTACTPNRQSGLGHNTARLGGLGPTLLIMLTLCLATTAAHSAPLQPELEALQALDQAGAEIRARRYDRAEILLERVLMLQPENAQALIELALLMAARNHTDGALALVQSLIDDERSELSQIQALKNLQAQIKQGATHLQRNPYALNAPERQSQLASQSPPPGANQSNSASPVRWRGEINWGMSTNPLARTSAKAIAITLPDGPLSLPLTQNQRAGQMGGASLSRTTDTGSVELAIQGTSISDASTATRVLAWTKLPQAPWWNATQQPVWLAYAQTQRGLDGQQRTQAGLTAINGQQKYSLSAYREDSAQDRGMISRIEYYPTPWQGIQAYAALERSKSNTGPQGHWRVLMAAERPVGDQAKMLIQWTRQTDTYSYSPLLENGARRHLLAAHVAYEQHHPLEGEKVFTWRVFTGERQSNLSLFHYKETGIQLQWVRKWP